MKFKSLVVTASSVRFASAFSPSPIRVTHRSHRLAFPQLPLSNNDDNEDEAARLRKKAQDLREQVRQLEALMGDERKSRYPPSPFDPADESSTTTTTGKSLKNKRILIVGANGRLGSMVTRHLLRSHPEVQEVVAAVHYVGQATTRGYGRLSYEVGAEDGRGSIGAAWSGEDERNASFEYDAEVMGGYNLNKLRVVEVELLNPNQVRTITEEVDAVVFCATDFEGNRPRAVASLNAALLFRAVADPLKGRVEIEGVRNCLEGLVAGINDRRYKENLAGGAPKTLTTGPTQFVLVSSTPDAFSEFDTPFGEFNGLKRQGEYIVANEFPSVSYSILQMGRYDERVEEGLELLYEEAQDDTLVVDGVIGSKDTAANTRPRSIWDNEVLKRINRRDAARAVVEALLDSDLENKKAQVYTCKR
ncbi:hypothetical protein HJC23_012723 [Cyclotella cryptica]|uniref:Uncharacterized protein n=1 Tax=Cyclotella cryptica TaxID=29204 RepID=A0ABD3NVI6_9STRA|eukprot:CCRYP_019642-RA/>CCRYP_019642-RA protein AED:0.39 eAED:0.39 QI:0/-1/0/1/-1/1/1/0/417